MLSKAALRSREKSRVEFPESEEEKMFLRVARVTRPISVLKLLEVW